MRNHSRSSDGDKKGRFNREMEYLGAEWNTFPSPVVVTTATKDFLATFEHAFAALTTTATKTAEGNQYKDAQNNCSDQWPPSTIN